MTARALPEADEKLVVAAMHRRIEKERIKAQASAQVDRDARLTKTFREAINPCPPAALIERTKKALAGKGLSADAARLLRAWVAYSRKLEVKRK